MVQSAWNSWNWARGGVTVEGLVPARDTGASNGSVIGGVGMDIPGMVDAAPLLLVVERVDGVFLVAAAPTDDEGPEDDDAGPVEVRAEGICLFSWVLVSPVAAAVEPPPKPPMLKMANPAISRLLVATQAVRSEGERRTDAPG